jgi:protoporphyrinogen IX oxidase
MRWVLSFHIIFMVAWFAGLFYLPRLFVYHTKSADTISLDRFKTMEHKLFYYIMTPAAILTTLFGLWLFSYNEQYYIHATWMEVKLMMVLLLWIYHLYCGRLIYRFKHNKNRRSEKFYRVFNEMPTLLLVVIVIMAVAKP